MPMKHDLDFAGHFSLCKAIDSFGGYPAVAERLGRLGVSHSGHVPGTN